MIDPLVIYQNVLKAGEDWADKKSAFEALDDNTKSVLADMAGNFMDSNDKMSKAEAETRAYRSGDFKTHLSEKAKARKEWLRAQVKYDSLKLLAELRRSEESTRRQEMKL